MFAGFQAGDGLRRMHLGRRTKNDRFDFTEGKAVGEFGGDVRDAVFGSYFPGWLEPATHQ